MLHRFIQQRPAAKPPPGRRAAIAQKESQRWLSSLAVTQQQVPKAVRVITICDREGDIYELFAHGRPQNSEFLIRAAQNRNTKADPTSTEVQPLFAAVRQTPCQGETSLVLQRTPRRAARQTRLSIRFTQLWLQPPDPLKHHAPVAVTAAMPEVVQPAPADRAEPITVPVYKGLSG